MSGQIAPMLRQGGVMKWSHRTGRFFVVQRSKELHVDQSEAKRLVESGAVRPNGIDSKGIYVFAINAKNEGWDL